MGGTRFKSVFREALGSIAREVRIALTPVPSPRKWVFLIGCYNSGTTLLSELMGRHPEISALPTEGHFITDQFRKDYELGLPRMWALREEFFRLTEDDSGPDPIRIKKEWGMRLDLSRPILLEKSPPNAPRARWLQHHFQPASFIAIVRNGYAVAEGIHRKADPQHLRDGWPMQLCAEQWRRSNEMLLEDAPHIERLHWVRYEDLTEHPDRELARIAKFLEAGPFPPMTEDANFAIHERSEPIKNMNFVSMQRLSPGAIREINSVASEMLAHFGYDIIEPEAVPT